MEDTYYAIELNDYATPAFCSGFTRTYAGTKGHLADFMEALSKAKQAEAFQPFLDAYRAWLRGEPTGVVTFNYGKCWNIRPLEIYQTVKIDLSDFSMEHLNIWQCPHTFQADGVRATVVYAKDAGKWYRFVQAAFQRLEENDSFGGFIPADDDRFWWGHPAMLKRTDDHVLSNRLLFQERELGGKEAMLRDFAAPTEIDFTGFMEDIMGDG